MRRLILEPLPAGGFVSELHVVRGLETNATGRRLRLSNRTVTAMLLAAIVAASSAMPMPAGAHGAPGDTPEPRPDWTALTPTQLDAAATARAAAILPGKSGVIGSFETRNRVLGALEARGIPMVIDDAVADTNALRSRGYLASHGWVTFKGEGLAFGRLPNSTPFTLDDPYVLLYAPVNKSLSDAVLSDLIPDAPYELVGAAWFSDYNGTTLMSGTPTETPPTLAPVPNGILPAGGWFRHGAGCHMNNGQFVAFDENLPNPADPFVVRFVTGFLWCGSIGAGSTFVPTDPNVTPYGGQPGVCALSRNLNPSGQTPRPIMEGSTVSTKRPAFAPLVEPGAQPSVRPRPTSNNTETLQLIPETAAWLAEKIVFAAWQFRVSLRDTGISLLNSLSNTKCQLIGTELSVANGPTFWHGGAWDTHLFFRPDGTTTAGITDFTLIPNGYTGPSIAFTPATDALHVLDLIPVPPSAPTAVTVTPGNGQLVVDWSPPSSAVYPGVVASPLTGFEVTVTKSGFTPVVATVLGSTRQTTVSALSAGTYNVTVRARNVRGLGVSSSAVAATVTGAAPVVTWAYGGNQPNNAGWIMGSLTANVTATDPNNVARIEWWSSGNPTHVVVNAPASSPSLTTQAGVGSPGPQWVKFFAVDVNGNQSPTFTVSANIDQFAPQVRIPVQPFPTVWNRGDVPVRWEGFDMDNSSGLDPNATSAQPAMITGEGSAQTVTVTVTDHVGRSAAVTSGPVKIDRTKPVTSVSGILAGWTNQTVVGTLSATDALSGVASTNWTLEGENTGDPLPNYSSTATIVDEGDYELKYSSIDGAGNVEGRNSTRVRIDKTPPGLIGRVSSESTRNANGWYNGPVFVEWDATDALSGVDITSLPGSTVITADGTGQTASGTVRDIAGNSRTVNSPSVNVDRTSPTTSVSGVPAGTPTSARLSFTSTDALSGVDMTYASVDGAPAVAGTSLVITTVGTHTVEYWSTDRAGNVEAKKSVVLTIAAAVTTTTTTTSIATSTLVAPVTTAPTIVVSSVVASVPTSTTAEPPTTVQPTTTEARRATSPASASTSTTPSTVVSTTTKATGPESSVQATKTPVVPSSKVVRPRATPPRRTPTTRRATRTSPTIPRRLAIRVPVVVPTTIRRVSTTAPLAKPKVTIKPRKP